ncbi:MAG: hypothetical protein QM767_02615 [Anaeromyxobacter sp.]
MVVATGHAHHARVPAAAAALPPGLLQVVPTEYRHPGSLPPGGVLVVGAGATGVQLAAELHASGRPVTLAVGRHTRLPRRYRGHDVLWWMDRAGLLTEPAAAVPDLAAARAQPSAQLVGRPDHRTLDLAALQAMGIRLTGRLAGVDGGRLALADDLLASVADAERRLERVLARIDDFAERERLAAASPERRPPVQPVRTPARLDLAAEGIRTVLWATGYRRSYPWLHAPVLDARGELIHEGGVTPAPGLYVLGLPFLRRRNSTFLDGVGADARDLVDHLAGRLQARRAA